MSTKRLPFTIQLTPGKDDDLIAQIKALPEGERNTAIKNVLRSGFALSGNNPILHNAPIEPSDLRELSERVATIQEMFNQLPEYLAEVMRETISQLPAATLLQSANEQDPEPLEVEDAPRLSTEELAKREAKMKRQSW